MDIVSGLSTLMNRSRVVANSGSAVVILEIEEDGKALVKYAADLGLQLTAFYGDEPDVLEEDSVYVTAGEGLSGYITVDTEDMYIEVPARSNVVEIKEAVTEKAPALWVPFLTEDGEITTGELLAVYPRNPLAPIYGELPRIVLGVEGLLGTGGFVRSGHRTVKGVAGYDLTGLFVGSDSRLGLITRVRFRLWARPPARAVWAAGKGFEGHWDDKVRRKRIVPFYFEGRTAIYAEGRPERLKAIKKELKKTTSVDWDDVAAGDNALEVLNRCYIKSEPVAEKSVNEGGLAAALGGPFSSAVSNNSGSV
jgi:FAD/FMN-containing dehydrogenase